MDPGEQQDKNWCIVILKFMGFYWRGIFMILWPCISLVVFLLGFEERIRCLFVVMLMAGYWVTEVIPLGVTGMVPVVLIPLLGVQDTGSVCLNYMNKTNFIFMGSIFIALGIEYCGLHKRVAYCVILCMGCSPRRLHFGLTFVTALLSMFLINAACTAMMLPIIEAILVELEAQGVNNMYKPKLPDEERPRPTNITIAYYLSAAFASTIGGIGTLVGTGTNLTYKGIYEKEFESRGGNQIDFVPWMLFNVPPMLLMTIFCWLSLQFIFMGLWRPNSEDNKIVKAASEHEKVIKDVIKTKMIELGKFSWNEIGVLTLFIICILAWLFRKPQIITGWGNLYKKDVADATPAIAVVLLFAIIPGSWAFFDFCTKDKSARPTKASAPLVPWSFLQQKFPWGLLFLLGGGSALADAGNKSGMSAYLGEKLKAMKSLPSFAVLCVTSLFAEWATELTSNVAICNILTPVLINMSMAMEVHPMSITLTAAIMCSFAFLLPVGTPANALVSEYVNLKTGDMVKGGILLKIFSWIIYMALYPTYGTLMYDQTGFPSWVVANTTNTTTVKPK